MKATEAVLFCGVVHYAVQDGDDDFESIWMKSLSVTIQMKAAKQFFPVILFTGAILVDKELECLK